MASGSKKNVPSKEQAIAALGKIPSKAIRTVLAYLMGVSLD